MPPKKKETEPKPPALIGRVGTSLKVGIVGLPNVGKSTFFNVLTKSQAEASNFPFCTIDPNESRVPVPDSRLDFLADFWKPPSKVPAFLNVVDIAGLVKGASENLGLGNAFLSHIKDCDAIFHLIRVFDDEEITHVDGDVNPVRDIQTINEELRLKDVQYVEARVESTGKNVLKGTGGKELKAEYDVLKRVQAVLDEGKALRQVDWSDLEIEELNKHLFITAKPLIFLVNMSKKDFIRKKNKHLAPIKQYLDQNDPFTKVILFSAGFELDMAEMENAEDREKFCTENKVESSLEKIIIQGYKSLNLMYYFTAGEKEVKAWPIQIGTKAPQAAGRIHTDFEAGFIMAEVMKFDDFKETGSEAACKAGGKYRQQGKNYIVEDGDIILFKFNAGAGLSGKKK
jgi:obg-like ATPase 1